MSNVKVAVRVRPLTKREEEQGAKIVLAVDGDTVRITNLKQAPSYQEHDSRQRLRQFAFDFCYWSADGSKRRFASQEMIYEDLGTKVLDAVFEGFNACVLAYGQSGSGKTYTMMGYNGDLGLTPRICQGLFDRMAKVENKRVTFRTEVSFLEIYNERVGDLLRTAPCRRQRHALRVREHPKFGPCVQDLSKHVVTDFNAVQALIERGIQNRSVAATKMHDRSSRSHAIFTINFTQARVDEEFPSEVVSKIHLVDLAGSEKATVHMSKIRLKEGANINKSLVALGGVICALAEKSMSQWSLDSLSSSRSHASSPGEHISVSSSPLGSPHRGQQPFIPYRDSVLTWLLKDSLGGNSKTIMVATISPASTAYNETISTLRYTQRAKRIVNKPIVNEDPNVKLIRELRAEIARLRGMLLNPPTQIGVLDLPAESSMPVAEIILRNQDKAQELTKMWIDKWHYFQKQVQELSCQTCIHRNTMESLVNGGTPYLVGVSDSVSSGVHIFYLKEGDMVIGNSSENENAPDIILMGEKVAPEHCCLSLQEGTATITPMDATVCLLNENALCNPGKLSQGDMVQLGRNNALQFVDPKQCPTRDGSDLASKEILLWPVAQAEVPSTDAHSEDPEMKTVSRSSGLQVLENFNKILEMKFHAPVSCATFNQSSEWEDSGADSQPKNSPGDSGMGDTECSSNAEATLDLITDKSAFHDDHPERRAGSEDPAPPSNDKSEGEEYDDWSDADDFSYFEFDDDLTRPDELHRLDQRVVTDSRPENFDHCRVTQHIDYLALPMQSFVSRRLSPIQECDTRSPSPIPDQINTSLDHNTLTKTYIPVDIPSCLEQKCDKSLTSPQDSISSAPPIVKESPLDSFNFTESDDGISWDSLDVDSLDEETASCDSEFVFGVPTLGTPLPEQNSDDPLIQGGKDEVQEIQHQTSSVAVLPHQQPEVLSDSSYGRPIAAGWSAPTLTKSGSLHNCDRVLRQKYGFSSSSDDERSVRSAQRNQKPREVLSRNGSSQALSLRSSREKSCDAYTSSSEDESCQHGTFSMLQSKSSKAKQRFEQMVLENRRKRRRKTAPKKSKAKTFSSLPKVSLFLPPLDHRRSPPPLPMLKFVMTTSGKTPCSSDGESATAKKWNCSSPETIRDSEEFHNGTPVDNKCLYAACVQATNTSGVDIDLKDDSQNCIPDQDLHQDVQSGTGSERIFDHAEHSNRPSCSAHGINSHQYPDTVDQLQPEADIICDRDGDPNRDDGKTTLQDNVHDRNSYEELVLIAQSSTDSAQNFQHGDGSDSIIDDTKDLDRISFSGNNLNVISYLDSDLLGLPLQGIDTHPNVPRDEDFGRFSQPSDNWLCSTRLEHMSPNLPGADGASEIYRTVDYTLDCTDDDLFYHDPCKLASNEASKDHDADWVNRTEQGKPFSPILDYSSLSLETGTAIQDLYKLDHPSMCSVSNSNYDFSQHFDDAMSANNTRQSFDTSNALDDTLTARMSSSPGDFDNPGNEHENVGMDSEAFELTCWSDIAAGQHEPSDQLHINMHSKPREKGLFDSSSSIWGQSWPSCDSLTMVYMGPEWGSAETNMIASIQSLEDLADSDFSEGHQEALERFVAKSMQARQKDSPRRFENAFVKPCSYHSSSDSEVQNHERFKISNETFTICSTDDPMAAIWEQQYVEAGGVAKKAVAAGYDKPAYADEWTNDTRPYKDLWAIHSYSIDDLQSHSSCLCKGFRTTANSCCNEAGNMSMGSTCTAEVSTQTESDSGIQTDATILSDATQTSVTLSSSGTQSVPVCTNASSQTTPLQMEVHVQTDPVCTETGSQTNPAASDSSAQSEGCDNKKVQIQKASPKGEACLQTEWHCADAASGTESNFSTLGTQTKTSSRDQGTQIAPKYMNDYPQSDREMYGEMSPMGLLKENDQRESTFPPEASLSDKNCVPEIAAADIKFAQNAAIEDGECVLEAISQTVQTAIDAVPLSETVQPNWEFALATEFLVETPVKEAALGDDKGAKATFSEVELVPERIRLENKLSLKDITLDESILLEEKVTQKAFQSGGNHCHDTRVVDEEPTMSFVDDILISEEVITDESVEQEVAMLKEVSAEERFAPEPALPDGKLEPETELPGKVFSEKQISPRAERASETARPSDKPLPQDNNSIANKKLASCESFSGIQVPPFHSGIYIGFHGNTQQMQVLDMKISFTETMDSAASASVSLQLGRGKNPVAENKDCASTASTELPLKSQDVFFMEEKDFANTVPAELETNAVPEPLETNTGSTQPEEVSSEDINTFESNENLLKPEEPTEIIENLEGPPESEGTSLQCLKSKETSLQCTESKETLVGPLKSKEKLVNILDNDEELTKSYESADIVTGSGLLMLGEEPNEDSPMSGQVLDDTPESIEISEEFVESKAIQLNVEDSLESSARLSEPEAMLLGDNYESLETNKAFTESAEEFDEGIRLQVFGNMFHDMNDFHSGDGLCSSNGFSNPVAGIQSTCFCQDHNLADAKGSWQASGHPHPGNVGWLNVDDQCSPVPYQRLSVDEREAALWRKPDFFFKESLIEYFDDKFNSLENAVKASELELREFSQRFAGPPTDNQISSPIPSRLDGEDSTVRKLQYDSCPENALLLGQAAILDASAGTPPTEETNDRTRPIEKCSNHIKADCERTKPTDEDSQAYGQEDKVVQLEVLSDSQPDSTTSHLGQNHSGSDASDEEYYKLPIVERQKHPLPNKSTTLKSMKRERAGRQRPTQRHCRQMAAQPSQTKTVQLSDFVVRYESGPKDDTSAERKSNSEGHAGIPQTQMKLREVATPETASARPHRCHRSVKCTCDTEASPQQLNLEAGSDAEPMGEDLPEDIVQLLRECRAVRKKAWKEIALAHQQISITHSTKKRNMCAVHRMESFEGS